MSTEVAASRTDAKRVEISVIVTAHNRKVYLARALKSVLNQTLPRSKYEIVVVKNFDYEEVDSLIKENGIMSISNDSLSLGEDKSLGFKNSSGRIITFLDDDDTYQDNRLERLLEVFDSNEGTCYVRNNCNFVDTSGNDVGDRIRQTKENVFLKKVDTLGQLKFLLKIRAPFNSSCIALTREVLSKHSEVFPSVFNSVDYYLFLAAINSGKPVACIADRLTNYNYVSTTSTSRPTGDMRSFLRKAYSVRASELRDMVALKTVFVDRVINWCLDSQISMLKLQADILNTDTVGRGAILADVLRYIPYSISLPSKFNPFYIAYGLISIFSRASVRRILHQHP